MARTTRLLRALNDLATFAVVAIGTPVALLNVHGTPGTDLGTAATTLRTAITNGRFDLLTGDTIAAPIAAFAWAGWALLIVSVTAVTIAQVRGQLRPGAFVARAPNFVRRIAASAALIISLASRTSIAGAAPSHQCAERPGEVPPPGEEIVVEFEQVAWRADHQALALLGRIARGIGIGFVLVADAIAHDAGAEPKVCVERRAGGGPPRKGWRKPWLCC